MAHARLCPKCRQIVRGKHRCGNAAKPPDSPERAARQRMYNDRRWREASKLYLRHQPLCVNCERQGRLTPATCVDHVKAHKGDYTLFWEVENWAASCAPCNNARAAKGE